MDDYTSNWNLQTSEFSMQV
ncbi:Protein of unknown function [Bacillus toyonensis]|nr:Protein of unknown function [Bacillus toyonensis]